MPTGRKKWEIESAARTLVEAEEIKVDKKLYAAAIREIKRQREAANAALYVKGSNTND